MEARYLTDLEWRICHAVNIYVFRNGRDGEQPALVHVPPSKKKNMRSVLCAIQERVKYPVGYAAHLYKMDGTKIKHPCELEVYNNYVVASNYDKHFKCAQYGRKKSPLLVLNRESKHVRVLRLQNQNYHEWMLKKKAVGEERPQFIYPTYYTSDNARAQDLPVGQMGNFVPPGVKGGGGSCCKRTGGKTFRVGQEKQANRMRGNQQQEFVVNTCVLTNTRKPHEALKKSQDSILKKQQVNKDEEASQDLLPRKGQLSKKYESSLIKVKPQKSDIINANVVAEVTVTKSEPVVVVEPLENVAISDSELVHSEQECSTAVTEKYRRNGTSTEQETTSEEALDKKYDDMIKKLKKAKSRRRKEKHEDAGSNNNISRNSKTKTNVIKDKTEPNRRDANRREMLVIPPPPTRYRDDQEFLNDSNVKSKDSLHTASNTSWNSQRSSRNTRKMVETPYILPDGQLRPQPRHPFLQRLGMNSQIQALNTSRHLGFVNPADVGNVGYGSQQLIYPVAGGIQGTQVGQVPQPLPTARFGQPVFGQFMVHNGGQLIPGQTTSQAQSGPSQVFSCSSSLQQPVYGHPGIVPQYFMAQPQAYPVTGIPQYFAVPAGDAEAYNLQMAQAYHPVQPPQSHREEQSDAEVDIPFTPMQKGGRTYRIGANKSHAIRQQRQSSDRRVELDPVKSRNVAIQMGHPGQDSKTESFKESCSQNMNSNRPQMIPVKVAYYTANGQKHLDDAYILQDDDANANSTGNSREVRGNRRNSQIMTSRVFAKTSNASTQVNHHGQPLPDSGRMHDSGRRKYETISRPEPLLHSNQSIVEYFVSGAQEANSEAQFGDLAMIQPPTEFREIFNNSSRYRNFQPEPPYNQMDHSSRPDQYF